MKITHGILNKTTHLITALFLGGCVYNGIPSVSTHNINQKMMDNTKKMFVGVPVIFSMEGSTARLDENWILTAAHNKFMINMLYDDVYYHPTCDIALIRTDGVNTVHVGALNDGVGVYHIGYPILYPISVNYGKYYSRASIKNYQYPNCEYGLSDASSAGGMSGGGVYNTNFNIVGIHVGVLYNPRTSDARFDGSPTDKMSMFVPLEYVSEWITEVTGTNFYK